MNITNFQLDKRLGADCIQLGYLNWKVTPASVEKTDHEPASVLLLMNNAEIPWFVIVPIGVTAIDIDELPEQHQLQLLKEVNALSGFLKKHYSVDKINFAAIGNIVSQMHIHLVARNKLDSCWPGVVWGTKALQQVTTKQVDELIELLKQDIEFFKN